MCGCKRCMNGNFHYMTSRTNKTATYLTGELYFFPLVKKHICCRMQLATLVFNQLFVWPEWVLNGKYWCGITWRMWSQNFVGNTGPKMRWQHENSCAKEASLNQECRGVCRHEHTVYIYPQEWEQLSTQNPQVNRKVGRAAKQLEFARTYSVWKGLSEIVPFPC